MSSYDCMDLCRLCLVKDRVSVPIFEGEGDVRQIFLKIAACLPVKVGRDDKLPKKICDDCVYKVELLYDFWNTTANAEKQLLQWLGEDGEDKQGYVSSVMNSELMKQETAENRLDSSAMQTEEHQNNMNMNMMDQMGLTMPIIMSTDQQQITSVPMASSGNNIQAVPGTSSQSSRGRKSGNNEDEEEESEEEENSDDECDNDGGINVKEEAPDTGRNVEPSFVNVSIPCDEAGPSGLQQQKLTEMPEMVMAQSSEGDPKSGCLREEDLIYSQPESLNVEYQLYTIETDAEDTELYEIIQNNEDIDLTEACVIDPLPSSGSQASPKPSEPPPRPRIVTYECPNCPKKFRKRQQYTRHLRTHDDSSGGACPQCERQFPDDEKLQKHMIKAHQNDRPFPCQLCGKAFKTEEFLKVHTKQHNKRFTCDVCGISKVSGYDLRLHKKRHNQEYTTFCGICHKGFYTNQTLERHVLTHTGEKPFICKICNSAYASAAYLSTHVKSHWIQREKHKCNVCDFESHWKAALKVHMKIHTGDNQYTCDTCGKSVSSKTYLRIHMRIHTGEKPHVCEICGRAFSVKKYLMVHLRTHTGEKPYECRVCQKRFSQQGSLNSHVKLHNERI